jgi:hypothetical protein
MRTLCIFVGMAVFGWVGSWLVNMIGFTTGFVVGGIGNMAGVYAGWRINRYYFG